jgi:hypothetical protein
MTNAGKDKAVGPSEPLHVVDPSPIPLLEATCNRGQSWDKLAPLYGVTHADPPWKTSLYGTFECLAARGVLPSFDRRQAEDQLAEVTYRDVSAPERQLLALAHTMIIRGLISEDALNRRMNTIRARLQTV